MTPLATTVPPEVSRRKIRELPWGANVETFTPATEAEKREARQRLSEEFGLNVEGSLAVFLGSFRAWHGVGHFAEAARVLAGRFGCSVRQARRYVERATQDGPAAVPEATTVFTVRLPATLVARVRARARESGSTISALVVQALTEFLARGQQGRRGDRGPRRR